MSKNNPHITGTIVLTLVLLSAVIGIYYIYTASTGKAFMQPMEFKVIQTSTEKCCCRNSDAGHPYEIFGHMLKDADAAYKTQKCSDLCGREHRAKYFSPGKCGMKPLKPVVTAIV